ncbi:hypothetical protein QJS04_geneDACA000522 [Acorus gramineus]|uniref:WD repeat-containing protein 44 n=1 Tax=Acorus gramineus TaxID=55184 RepID=A0AAV9AQT0_ACOGR|nr:hypothetical protein QJS04_geneDACA000522 [Acorus gramineus]
MSEPTSVQERRRRLLQQLGLTGDPSLSRLKLTAADEDDDDDGDDDDDDDDVARFGCRSASYDEIRTGKGTDSGAFARSRSESSVDSSGPPPIGGLQSSPPRPVHNNDNGSDGGVEEGSDGGGGGRERPSHRHRRYCTIKNLDNGEEFVVNGLREDGTWDKLREVGTGRQLTAEEFHMSVVGHSPIVQELMRRQNFEESSKDSSASIENGGTPNGGGGGGSKWRRRGGWLKSIKNTVTGGVAYKERRSSDERDTSSEKGGRRSSSATDDSQDAQFHHHINGGCGPERTKVRQYGKSCKELTALYMSQDIQAHHGSIWAIRFSLDGRYLASAGEDRVIHVWQVSEAERKGELLVVGEEGNLNQCSASPEPVVGANGSYLERSKRGKGSNHRKSVSLDQIAVPEHVFALSEKPVCSFSGHFGDVLDLSWVGSLANISSDLILWNMSSSSSLKIFSHSDYGKAEVTSIQFNPVDDRYFISGSLDAKVRIWSIPDRKVVDWNDLHEMVTAACYTPDGQFAPGCSPQVLVTSADSRIRVIDGVDLVHKFKEVLGKCRDMYKLEGLNSIELWDPVPELDGYMLTALVCSTMQSWFRNTSSQISASLTANGKYVICASEDSHVYVWRYDSNSRPNRTKVIVSITQSYEHFHCRDVSVAIPWPGFSADDSTETDENQINGINEDSETDPIFLGDESTKHRSSYHHINGTNGSTDYKRTSSANGTMNTKRTSSVSAEENLIGTANKRSPQSSGELSSGGALVQERPAWGMVILTAGRGGEIRVFQNFGLPIRI